MGRGFSLTGANYIKIGNNFSAGKNLSLATYKYYNGKLTGKIPEIFIGDNVSLMDNCAISCMDKIIVGNGTLMGANVFITDNLHGRSVEDELPIRPNMRNLYSSGPVIIGKNVWLGRNVCIMPGVIIGDYSVVGANAVVTHDIPSRCVAGGIPAKVIRKI